MQRSAGIVRDMSLPRSVRAGMPKDFVTIDWSIYGSLEMTLRLTRVDQQCHACLWLFMGGY